LKLEDESLERLIRGLWLVYPWQCEELEAIRQMKLEEESRYQRKVREVVVGNLLSKKEVSIVERVRLHLMRPVFQMRNWVYG
jgi:hypothetical protein